MAVDILGGTSVAGVGTQIIKIGGVVALGIMAAIIISIILYVLFTVLRYGITGIVIDRAGGYPLFSNKKIGIRENKAGTLTMKVLGDKKEHEPPKEEYIYPVKKLFIWSKVVFLEKVNNTYIPLNPQWDKDIFTLAIGEHSVDAWREMDRQKTEQLYSTESFMSKYGSVIAFTSMFALIFVMGLIFFEQFGSIAEAFKQAASVLADAKVQAVQPK